MENGVVELRPPEVRSTLCQLWPAVAGNFQAAAHALAGQEPAADDDMGRHVGAASGTAVGRLPADWALPPLPPPAPWVGTVPGEEETGLAVVEFLWARETIRHVGTVVHRLLQQIGRQSLGDWESLVLESQAAVLHVAPVRDEALIIVAARRGTPMGWILRASGQAVTLAERYVGAGV